MGDEAEYAASQVAPDPDVTPEPETPEVTEIPAEQWIFMACADIVQTVMGPHVPSTLLAKQKKVDEVVASLPEANLQFLWNITQVLQTHVAQRIERIQQGLDKGTASKIILPNGRRI